MQPTSMMNGKAMTIAGFARRYTSETRQEIPALWRDFGPRLGEARNIVGAGALGVSQSLLRQGGEFTYMAGVQVASATGLPPDFTAIEVPARSYAVFAHDRHVSEIGQTIMRMVNEWLPASGYRVDGEPVLIEVYGEAFNPQTGLGGMEIWMPVTK